MLPSWHAIATEFPENKDIDNDPMLIYCWSNVYDGAQPQINI